MTCRCGGAMRPAGAADSAGGVRWRCAGKRTDAGFVMTMVGLTKRKNRNTRSCGRTRVEHPPLERRPRSIMEMTVKVTIPIEVAWEDPVVAERYRLAVLNARAR